MSKIINERITKYIDHKVSILGKRVYIAIMDLIFDAENYDKFDIDSDNNIFVTYSLKRDESIISDTQDVIQEKIRIKYRYLLLKKLEEEGYFVEYDDNDVNIYFESPLKLNNSDNKTTEHNILIRKKINPETIPLINADIDDSGIFDFDCED